MSAKWSSTILGELLDTAGGGAWQRWKAERAAQGLPPLDDFGRIPKPSTTTASRRSSSSLPKPRKAGGRGNGGKTLQETVTQDIEEDIERARSGSGAAAILPA